MKKNIKKQNKKVITIKSKKVNKKVFSNNSDDNAVKKILALCLIAFISIKAFADVVSGEDELAFITRSEFDNAKYDYFQQMDEYNNRVDSMVDGEIADFLSKENVSIIYNLDNQTIMNDNGILKVKPNGLLMTHLRADQIVGDTEVATAGVQKLVTSAMLYNNLVSLKQRIPTLTTASNRIWTSGTNGAGAWKGIITTLSSSSSDTDIPSAKLLKTSVDLKVDKTTTINGYALSSNVALSKSDVGLGNVVNTGDSATPTSGGTTKFTTGGAYTALANKQNKIIVPTAANQIFATTTTSGTHALKTIGNGISINGSNVLGHSISTITKEDTGKGSATAAITGLKYDEYGHIRSVSTTTMYPPTTGQASNYYWKGNGTGVVGVWQAANTTATKDSNVLITSGGVYTDLADKQDKLISPTAANQLFATTTTSGTYALKTVGNGVSINSSNVLGHSNSVTEQTTGIGSVNAAINSLKYDEYGHITSVSTTAMYPPTDKGTSGYTWTSNGTSTNPSWKKVPCPFPVGAVYIGIDNTNPSTYWSGTTWSKLSTNRTLMTTSGSGGGTVNSRLPSLTGIFGFRESHTDDGQPYGIVNKTSIFSTEKQGSIENPKKGDDTGGSANLVIHLSFANGEYHPSYSTPYTNEVYGKSDIVQPPAIAVCMWQRTG